MKYIWLSFALGLVSASFITIICFRDTEMALWYGVMANFFLAFSNYDE